MPLYPPGKTSDRVTPAPVKGMTGCAGIVLGSLGCALLLVFFAGIGIVALKAIVAIWRFVQPLGD